jgi:hypothetical protein
MLCAANRTLHENLIPVCFVVLKAPQILLARVSVAARGVSLGSEAIVGDLHGV